MRILFIIFLICIVVADKVSAKFRLSEEKANKFVLLRECIDNFAADFQGCFGKCRDIGCMSQQMKQKMTYK